MLAIRPSCELCGTALPPESDQARICTYECTFCVDCATWQLWGICPNCTGELVVRPRRPAIALAKHPASQGEVRKTHDVDAHQAEVHQRLLAGDLPEQLWTVAFANGRTDEDGYMTTAEEMDSLAKAQPGFVSVDAARGENGVGITVSRWSSVAALVAWRRLGAHADAQTQGRRDWYRWYRSDVARVDRSATFQHD